jgi:uncharacterized protein DUF4846
MKIKSFCNLFLFIPFLLSGFLTGQSTQSNTILTRFEPPKDFKRIWYKNNGFADWIRNLPLKESKSEVLDYHGKIFKSKDDTTIAAVVNWDIKGKRLEQCMDILIRFHAEYLWENNKQEKLVLPLPGRKSLKWKDWQEGFRPKFKGINFDLIKSDKYNSSKNNFNKFLNLVFAESHTQQFYYAFPQIEREEVQVGDIIIKKGIKGHAVIIVDLAKNSEGDLIALVGQGDTPACEFYLLNFKKDNQWIPLDFSKEIIPLPIKKKMTWDGLRRFE